MEPDQRRDSVAGAAALTVDGDVVTKLHRPGTDPQALKQRLRVAARSACVLSPLDLESVLVASASALVAVVGAGDCSAGHGQSGGVLGRRGQNVFNEWCQRLHEEHFKTHNT